MPDADPESYERRRRVPSQERSRETVEAVCAAAAAIIEEDGLTSLTTNAVAKRAGVSITSVYAYFPDKWAIVHELSDRFERARGDYLADAFADLGAMADWRTELTGIWRRLARFRVEVPGGVALRRAITATPRLAQLDREQTARAAADFAATIRARRPDIDPDEASRVAWTASVAAGALIDDACWSGEIDEARLATGTRLMIGFLAPCLDPAG
ncbi:MAG: TetR/AcrR family transcriptional regulator [Chloroflexota bacterium]